MAITRIRVADETWAFTSELYARVNAGLVVTRSGGVLIDTLPFPSETRQLKTFVKKLCAPGVKYVVNTQSAADHTYGSYLFPDAELLAHEKARQWQARYGARNLRKAKRDTPELRDVKLCLPRIVFNDSMVIRIGNKTVHLIHSPGPAPDTSVAYVPEEKVLFASDLIMHIPMICHDHSNIEAYKTSLYKLYDFNLEVIVQGHGDILLRGEVTSSIDRAYNYLVHIEELVQETCVMGGTLEDMLSRDLSEFDISTIPMGDMIRAIHRANLAYLWKTTVLDSQKRLRNRRR